VQRVPHPFGIKMKKTIEKKTDVDIDNVEDLTRKILLMLDGNPALDILLALANILVNIHIETNLDIDIALSAIKNMHAQALEDNQSQNEIH
jgi:hypothetical protein